MIGINTNLGSLIVQSNLKKSTNALNTAIERMTTGFKINRAKDNAANYSISTSMSTKINAYEVAEDNIEMGLDLLTTASDSLGIIEERLQRLRSLQEQALNGTYGDASLNAINTECNALIDEISRLYLNTEYNGLNLFLEETKNPDGSSGFIQEVQADESTKLGELGISVSSFEVYNSDGAHLASYTTDTDDTIGGVFSILSQHGIKSEIRNGVITLTSASGNYISGDLASALGISSKQTAYVESTFQTSSTPVEYELVSTSTTEVQDFVTTTTSTTTTKTVLTTTTSSTTKTTELVQTTTVGTSETGRRAYTVEPTGSIYINSSDKILDQNVTMLFGNVTIPDEYTVELIGLYGAGGYIAMYNNGNYKFDKNTTYGDILQELEGDYYRGKLEDGEIEFYQNRKWFRLQGIVIYSADGNKEPIAYISCIDEWDISVDLPETYQLSVLSVNRDETIVVKNKNTTTTLTVSPTDTIADLIASLRSTGLSASYSNGRFAINGSDDVYIASMSSSLENALGFRWSFDGFYTTKTETTTVTTTIWTTTTTETTKTDTIWTTTTTETTCTETISTTATLDATGSTTLRELGLGSGFNVTVVTDGSSSILRYDGDTSLDDILLDLRAKGLNAEFTNGSLSLSGTGDSYVQSDELSAVLNLGTLNKTSVTRVVNTDSNKLTYSKDIFDLLPDGLYAPGEIVLQAGIGGSESSKISVKIAFTLSGYDDLRNIGLDGNNYLGKIDSLINSVSEEQTRIGAAQNRLMSALDEVSIHYENLMSSRSTLRDSDIAEVSSEYIRNQILQQASATLLATANQTPAIALQLL